MITCEHRSWVRAVSRRSTGCEECLRDGDRWVRLRMCLTCGNIGCCDSSRGRHAARHFESTGHPLMRSAEPGEEWAWCYVDRRGFEAAEVGKQEAAASQGVDPPAMGPFVDALYLELFSRGVAYFFPEATLELTQQISSTAPAGSSIIIPTTAPELDWFGSRYRLSREGTVFSVDELRLLDSIRRILSARYQVLFDVSLAPQRLQLFRGLPEDRYVSAFLDVAPHSYGDRAAPPPDRVSDAIEVLRVSALTTYENRRIETGVLLFGAMPEECHPLPSRPAGAMPYSIDLTRIRSFHRLCDGLQTLALVDREGFLVELVDVHEWAVTYANLPVPVPTIERYAAHSRATLCGGHVCLVLTPHGEIKIFSDGVQVFSFLDGHWRLTDAREKYAAWREAIGVDAAAERLYTVALDLAEDRRGALFVILDDPAMAELLIAPDDLLSGTARTAGETSKQQLHYLLREANVFAMTPAVLQSIARIDGAIVADPGGRLLAFGTILRLPRTADPSPVATEGGRTTAALNASRFGKVLMVSEDGRVSFFAGGRRIWQL